MQIKQYICSDEKRKLEIARDKDLKGIDYLEVSEDQRELSVYFIPSLIENKHPIPDDINISNIKIAGGVRVTDIWPEKVEHLGENILKVQVKDNTSTQGVGDFSTYTLELVNLKNIDPIFSAIDFSFKINLLKDSDCRKEEAVCRPEKEQELRIDYLSRDYAGFRRLILDRLSVIMPDWKERSPADLGVAIAEVMAYAADHLTYYQDAVATEAYLGTARKRISIHRHARLLDYPMHDGCNARVWVTVKVEPGSPADGELFPGQKSDEKGGKVRFLTKIDGRKDLTYLSQEDFEESIRLGAQVFEPMNSIFLHSAQNEMQFYTWGEEDCCLPKNATSATLVVGGDESAWPAAGDVLIFEEADNPEHRHAVRLTKADSVNDSLSDQWKKCTEHLYESAANSKTLRDPYQLINIEWSAKDALPFPLCISKKSQNIGVARGNVLLADHGLTVDEEDLEEADDERHYSPKLRYGPLTWQAKIEDGQFTRDEGNNNPSSACDAFSWQITDVYPVIELRGSGGGIWVPRRDLLNSGRFDRDFVAEIDDDGFARLRFGNGVMGMSPINKQKALYRIGNGSAGNVGADSIGHISSEMQYEGINSIRNPLPAQNGKDPEAINHARLFAPQILHKKEYAVNEDDYAEVASRHPDVQKAVATLRWTGSWNTMFINVDRKGGRPVDASFKRELLSYLDIFRVAGFELEVEGPVYVPLDIAIKAVVKPDHFSAVVEANLLEEFSSRELSDGRRGFFHQDEFTFGGSVYFSRLVARAIKVPGVLRVEVVRFQRKDEEPKGELEAGEIKIQHLEIARLDNDPNNPENGVIEFYMEGGR